MHTKRILLCSLAACTFSSLAVLAQNTSKTNGDQKFVDDAAQTDMMEAHLAQLAQDQASAQGVKDYAQTLNTDHTKDYQQLSDAATKAGLTVPKGLDAAHNRMMAPLEKLKGAAFDRKYVAEMTSGHQKAIAEYTREASSAESPDIKTYANSALPVLQKHLDGAKDLAKQKTK